MRFAVASFSGDAAKSMITKSEQWSNSAGEKEKWEEIFYTWSEKYITGGEDNVPPEGKPVEIGVFYGKKDDSKALFISWGFLEDKILNENFGFGDEEGTGEDGVSSQDNKRMQPRFNSSYSFIRYEDLLLRAQKSQNKVADMIWLYPKDWNKTYNTKRSGYLKDRDIPEGKTATVYDQDLGRIPLRELFISTELIKRSIGGSKTVLDFIKSICEEINTSTDF
jgi:hypothetical protein